MDQLKLVEEFDRYFNSSNGVDVPEKVSVPTKEWRALRDALINQVSAVQAESAKLTELQADAPSLLFALHDAWPYVHQSCTIKRIKKNHQRLMQKHGDFTEFYGIKTVAWFKHGPYEEGEPLQCVFEDPKDEVDYSALIFKDLELNTIEFIK